MGADEGQWQTKPSQAEGDRQGDDGESPRPIPEQPAEGGRAVAGETVDGET